MLRLTDLTSWIQVKNPLGPFGGWLLTPSVQVSQQQQRKQPQQEFRKAAAVSHSQNQMTPKVDSAEQKVLQEGKEWRRPGAGFRRKGAQ